MTDTPMLHPVHHWPHPSNRAAAEEWLSNQLRSIADATESQKLWEDLPSEITGTSYRSSSLKTKQDIAYDTLRQYFTSWQTYEPPFVTGQFLDKLTLGEAKLPLLHAMYKHMPIMEFLAFGIPLVKNMAMTPDTLDAEGKTVAAWIFLDIHLQALALWTDQTQAWTIQVRKDGAVQDNLLSVLMNFYAMIPSKNSVKEVVHHTIKHLDAFALREVVAQPLVDHDPTLTLSPFVLAAQYGMKDFMTQWIETFGLSIIEETTLESSNGLLYPPYMVATIFAQAETIRAMLQHPTYPVTPSFKECFMAGNLLSNHQKQGIEGVALMLKPMARNHVAETADFDESLAIWQEACEPYADFLVWPTQELSSPFSD